MRTVTRNTRGKKRDLFAELSEGMAALAQAREGERTLRTHAAEFTPARATYLLKLPRSVKEAAAQLAKSDGVSLNQFIASTVAEELGSLKSAEIFLAERAGRAKHADLLRYLRKAPRVAPIRGDERPK